MRVGKTMYLLGVLMAGLLIWSQLYAVKYHEYHFNYALLLYAFIGVILFMFAMLTLWFKW